MLTVIPNGKNYYGADGIIAIDPNNSNLYYGFIQNGSSLYISNNAGNFWQTELVLQTEFVNWLRLSIQFQGVLYAGYDNLYKIVNNA
jgi:hypothetical protein